jgi:polar amino acid transport system substrate-binding protein
MYNFDGAFTFEENIEKLLNGRIDILLDNEYAVLSYLSSKNMESEVVALEPALDETVTYLGFSKKASLIDLREKYDVVISEMRADGTIDAILARYFE